MSDDSQPPMHVGCSAVGQHKKVPIPIDERDPGRPVVTLVSPSYVSC